MSNEKDYIPLGTPGKSQIFEEPVLDVLTDKSSKDIKEKPPVDLTANDKFVLSLMDRLPVADLLQKGYMQISLEIGSGISIQARTLVFKQLEHIASDVSHFQQQVEHEEDEKGIKTEVWRPSPEEVRIYQMKRTLADVVYSVGEVQTGPSLRHRLDFFDNLDGMILNAIYRKVQQFFTAVSLLFPSDNQKQLVTNLKKVSAPLL